MASTNIFFWYELMTSDHAVYRGFDRNPEHESFDLKKLEKYGGRAPR